MKVEIIEKEKTTLLFRDLHCDMLFRFIGNEAPTAAACIRTNSDEVPWVDLNNAIAWRNASAYSHETVELLEQIEPLKLRVKE